MSQCLGQKLSGIIMFIILIQVYKNSYLNEYSTIFLNRKYIENLDGSSGQPILPDSPRKTNVRCCEDCIENVEEDEFLILKDEHF